VALLADASTPFRPTARPLAPFSSARAPHVGMATFALLAFGLLLSIATTPDPLWWHLHFSQLGTFATFSGHVFNTTIVLTSVGVVLFALRVRAEMKPHAGTDVLVNRRAATIVPVLIALLGIHLSVVGFVPVNANEFLHDRGSTGAVFCFVMILASSRWTLRGMHRLVARATRRVSIGLVLTTAPYIAGYINLALFELIVFTLVFAWLLLFAGAVGRPAVADSRRAPRGGRVGSVELTVVVPPRPMREHVAVATRVPLVSTAPPVRMNRPRGAVLPLRRRTIRGQSSRQPDPEHPRTRHTRALRV
jgi:hypothetical membrane protein